MWKNCFLFLFALIVRCCIGQDLYLNRTSVVSMLGRKPKLNILSIQPVGQNINLGLDFLLPFLKVPIEREMDANGNEPALVNINVAALASAGIISASSALVSYLFRKYVFFEPLQRDMERSERNLRLENDLETEIWSTINNFKFIYKNSSGIKMDTSLPGLYNTIDETFHENNIDISSCLQKALCQRIQQATAAASYNTNTTGVDKIIDGLMSAKWIQRNFLRYTALNDVVGSRNESCNLKFYRCKWSNPMKNLNNIIETYLSFT